MMRGSLFTSFSAALSWIGSVALVAMMGLTVVDVAGRYLLNAPILGAFELTENLVLVLTFSFLGYTRLRKRHIGVSVVADRMPQRLHFLSKLFNQTVCLILFALVTVMSVSKAVELIHTGETSPNLAIPHYPFVLFLALGSLVMCLEYLRDIVSLVAEGTQDQP